MSTFNMVAFRRIFAVGLALILSIAPADAALGPDSIPAAFDELLKVPTLSNPAMIVIDGTTGQIIYEKNIYSQRKPASVMKVLAGAVTLEYLDPQSVFNTTINIAPEEKTVVIRGSLDPWISLDHNVARKMNRASLPYMGFNTLSAVKEANGGSLKNYKVLYSNLYSKDIANLKAFWAKRGFKPVFKQVTDEEAFLAQGDLVASENSPTVQKILDFMMLWSDNLLADRLAGIAARAAGYSPNIKGIETIFRTLLAQFEIDDSKLVVADASGLSKKNKITAKLMGELLYKIRKDERYALLYESLPIGGVSGTLQSRFTTTAPSAVGLVRAKTGTLNGTATLAGYVQSTDREYVFVTLADDIAKGNAALNKARAAIDRVLGRIAAPNIPAEISPVP
jgi:D-alanyl-D-alanine carboxypeptidase/D-alanyl-D-alanine-endopeptidase (penicillin-binding protein 4)